MRLARDRVCYKCRKVIQPGEKSWLDILENLTCEACLNVPNDMDKAAKLVQRLADRLVCMELLIAEYVRAESCLCLTGEEQDCIWCRSKALLASIRKEGV